MAILGSVMDGMSTMNVRQTRIGTRCMQLIQAGQLARNRCPVESGVILVIEAVNESGEEVPFQQPFPLFQEKLDEG